MTARILVTGGTGTLGRQVVGRLAQAGPTVRVLSRRPAPADRPEEIEWVVGDLALGTGVEEAVAGVGTIIHCASDFRRARKGVPGTRRFLGTARRAGVRHVVYISIVGVDRVPLGYYQVKLAEERLVEESGVPWTILRATQFHDLIRLLLATTARLPVMLVPSLRVQPIDASEVAARLVDLAAGPPVGRAPDLGGPQVRAFRDLASAYLRATGKRRLVFPLRLPGSTFRGYRQGGHLTPAHAEGRRTFEEYLAAQFG
ncbi:MAG TPA: NAD(P)H-binding protein [Pseudonocardiaceae bacterium]|nr:NAD(P)H-binding protein [Pseudonocardiaceae bacterium]